MIVSKTQKVLFTQYIFFTYINLGQNQNSSFHYENLTYQQTLRCFFCADKVTCDTNKATEEKHKETTFPFDSHEVL